MTEEHNFAFVIWKDRKQTRILASKYENQEWIVKYDWAMEEAVACCCQGITYLEGSFKVVATSNKDLIGNTAITRTNTYDYTWSTRPLITEELVDLSINKFKW